LIIENIWAFPKNPPLIARLTGEFKTREYCKTIQDEVNGEEREEGDVRCDKRFVIF